MINLDMVGRLSSDNELHVYGTGTADEFDGLVTRLSAKHRFDVKKRTSGYGPSDHASFHSRGVPVLHFFTGLHNDYHRPTDDFDKINILGLRRITLMVADTVAEIAGAQRRPMRRNVRKPLAAVPLRTGRKLPPQVYVGIRVRAVHPGLQIEQIFRGSPAEDAQLRVGDVLLKADGKDTNDVSDLRDIVRIRKAGDKITVVVKRLRNDLELTLTLQTR